VLHPDIQAKVHAELDDVVGRDVMPKWEDKTRLPYLNATIAETLRMSCVVALAVPHKASVDSTLAGYRIPKGTTLLLNVWAMHYDENEWENPHVFDPTRFLDDQGRFLHGLGTLSYLPFGAGRRVCVGDALVKQELFIVISRLMHEFTFEIPPDSPPPERVGFMCLVHMPKPYKICIKERV
jgi:cytochrome P450